MPLYKNTTAGAAGVSVKDEGAVKGDATTIDFVGAGVSASVLTGVATVTVTGGPTQGSALATASGKDMN